MIALEPIVSVTCLFMSLIYSIFYLFFQLLPVLFAETYGFSKESRAVIFVPVAVGAVIAGLVYSVLEPSLRRLAENDRFGTDRRPELRRLPPACCGSLLCVLALFLAGYAVSRPASHYAYLLVLEGAFGTGFLLIFIGLTNYLVDAYKARLPASRKQLERIILTEALDSSRLRSRAIVCYPQPSWRLVPICSGSDLFESGS
jgi:hypothetical protein